MGTARTARDGFSLIEITVAITVMLAAVLFILQASVQAHRLARTNRETALATAAARQALEQVQAETFSDAFARFNDADADDPGGIGTAPGSTFDVPGLRPSPDDVDGIVGQITFPDQMSLLGVLELREDVNDPQLELPRDLNGDGAVDALDHSGDYRLLPVRVELEWSGHNGNRTLVVNSLISER